MKTKSKTPINFAADYENTHPTFKTQVEQISAEGGLPVLEVYKLWRKYSDENYDQSAIVREFRQWYAEKLGLKKAT